MKLNIEQAHLVVFNMQDQLVPLLDNAIELVYGCRWAVDLFQTHHLPVTLIEHEKLGKVLNDLLHNTHDSTILRKQYFSLMNEIPAKKHLSGLKRNQIVLAGAEAHVCIFQSALDLIQHGFEVFVLADTISARNSIDITMAIRRLEKMNCQLISREMLFFELINHSEHDEYLPLALKFLDGRYLISQREKNEEN